jgi:hypothetical protein
LKKLTLLLAFCIIGLTASAQFWKAKRKPQPAVVEQQMPAFTIVPKASLPADAIFNQELEESDLMAYFKEQSMIKEAKHNMRFRVYVDASYNFSDLANLYVGQNRFSEAKWYLLQSNAIARNTDNSKHLVDNLLILANIKSVIGETGLALADLQEARDIAVAKGLKKELPVIEKKIKYLQTNKTTATKAELRYANAVEVANTAKAAPVN